MKCKMVTWFFSDLMFKLILILVFLLSLTAPVIFKNENFICSDIPSLNKTKNTIKSTGSTSMSHIISVLASDFRTLYPEYSYEKSETGSGTAPYLVKSGEADIGDMSRYMNNEEKSLEINNQFFEDNAIYSPRAYNEQIIEEYGDINV